MSEMLSKTSNETLLTKAELRNAIPNEYFERSTLKGFGFLSLDILIIFFGFYLGSFIPLLSIHLQYVLWPVWWYLQGTLLTSLWVLAHECGHRAFSPEVWINDLVGFILHSLLLVPYHSWRLTHVEHHAYTSNMQRDQIFVPNDLSDGSDPLSPWQEALQTSPIYITGKFLVMVLMGWPLYLFFNLSSNRAFEKKAANHFFPSSPLFNPRHYWLIVLSNIGLLGAIGILFYFAYTMSLEFLVKFYFIPYLWVNFWLVCITFLQHKHKNIVYYDNENWTFMKGAVNTVDRDYGYFLNHVLHHITDSHVVHHIFPQIPFWNAIKATEIVKNKLGSRYLYDDTPILIAFYQCIRDCENVINTGNADGSKIFVTPGIDKCATILDNNTSN